MRGPWPILLNVKLKTPTPLGSVRSGQGPQRLGQPRDPLKTLTLNYCTSAKRSERCTAAVSFGFTVCYSERRVGGRFLDETFNSIIIPTIKHSVMNVSFGVCNGPRMNAWCQYRNSLAFASSTTQANPSSRFSPVMALHRRTCQW